MRIGIFATADEASRVGADMINELFAGNPEAHLGVATGSTPDKLYAHLRADHAAGTFSLAKAKAFALDEYVGLDSDHPESYRNVLRRELVGDDKTGLTEEGLHTPGHGGTFETPYDAAEAYDEAIADAGVDLQILGIGADGHIGFNEPGVSLVSRTHVEALAPQTIKDNARFFDNDESKVPTTCMTQGLATIMDADKIVLFAFGEGKSDAVRELVEGAVSAFWPATILQLHPDVTVLVDEAAASQLKLTELYRNRWNLQ